jgi:RND family efflux transporter MFP subunit
MKKILTFLLKFIIIPLLILAMGFGGFRYMLKTKPKTQAIEKKEQVWVVTVVPINPTAQAPTVTLYGRVETPRTATLRTPTLSLNANAQVIELSVLEGDRVKKGDVLVRIEDNDSHLNLKQREAELADIEAQIQQEQHRHTSNLTALTHQETLLSLMQKSQERLRRLERQRVSSQSTLEEAQQAVERQKLALTNLRLDIQNHQARLAQLQAKRTRALAVRDVARLELARTKIIAPFTGIIAKVMIAVGDRVRSGDALLSVYDNTALELRAQIPSRYQATVLNALADGYQLKAHAQINQNSIGLELDRISGQINPDSGGIDGLFRVKKGEHLLRLGQFLSLFLSLPRQPNVVALPFEAVYGTNRIYKLVEGRMKGITIERIGEQINSDGKSHILVRSPELQSGDQVIITQLPNAMEGLKVRPVKTE